MEKKNMLFVDFSAGIAGVEGIVRAGIHYYLRTTTEKANSGEFREVSETLVQYGGGWNPEGFRGGIISGSAIGPLAIIEAAGRRRIYVSDIGSTVRLGKLDYEVRPCRADLMPLRLWERTIFPRNRGARRKKEFGLLEARRLCFGARKNECPALVYFAKGTTSVDPPDGAVARIGGSESSTVVFVDKFARPLAAYKAAGGWNSHYAAPISIPEQLEWAKLRPLGKSSVDTLFGVHG